MRSASADNAHPVRTLGAAALPAWLAGSLLLVLVGLIAASPRYLVFDERYYLQMSFYLADNFDFGAMMRAPLDVGAGPLYGYLHYFLSPLTALQPPTIRYVNVGCLILTLGTIAAILHRLGEKHPIARSAMLLAVPMVWPTTGIALTEQPALTLVSLCVLAVTVAVQAPEASRGRCYAFFALAGLCAGLAITGRQTYLPGLAGFLAIGLGNRRFLFPSVLASALALLAIAPMLIVWGGLSAPWLDTMRFAIMPEFGIMAFIYLATVTLLVAPRFVLPVVIIPRLRLFAVITAVAATLAAQLAGFHFSVSKLVVAKLSAGLQPLFQLGLNLMMIGIAAALAIAALHHLRERREDRKFLLFASLTVILTGTAAGIQAQFSSRYVLTAFPFALLMLQPWIRPGLWASARIMLGAVAGMASLTAIYRHDQSADPNVRSFAPQELRDKMPLYENMARKQPY